MVLFSFRKYIIFIVTAHVQAQFKSAVGETVIEGYKRGECLWALTLILAEECKGDLMLSQNFFACFSGFIP